MSSSIQPALLLIGSGPGIGLSTASLFATKTFTSVGIISRDASRLIQDQKTIEEGALKSGSKVKVYRWSVDITESEPFKNVLELAKETLGNVTCVIFNAARVAPSELLKFPEEEIMEDFKTTNIALYTTARIFAPSLSQLPASTNPSFLVTSSLLWEEPIPQVFSLSLVKSSQRNLVVSLAKTYSDIHFALLNVGGPVSKDDKYLNPTLIAEKYWELYSQPKEKWTLDLEILGGQ